MATQIMAAKMLCLKAVEKRSGIDIAQSVLWQNYLFQTAMDTTIEAVQIHGGNGYAVSCRAYDARC
jgi:alkylation response protein AidB-like acyl-CoA dehydrogenase